MGNRGRSPSLSGKRRTKSRRSDKLRLNPNSKNMIFNRKGKLYEPLKVFEVNKTYLIGVYQGNISKLDILIRYKQWEAGTWSKLRTPKHIHWAVDMLIKMHSEPKLTKIFLNYLISMWRRIKALKYKNQRLNFLERNLQKNVAHQFKRYKQLSKHGEYSIRFLILLARLLMTQEKTNREDAYMFKKLLEALKKGKDIFSTVSIASHTGH